MSTCAVMLVKDEADIAAFTVEHLLTQVDHVYVADNMSTDGTWDILKELDEQHPEMTLQEDHVVGYWQSDKTTALAQRALEDGHQWVVPCDADEYWYAPDRRPISEWLKGVTPDVQIVTAVIFNHLPTVRDPALSDVPNPFSRIGYRQREHQALPKVACRLRPDLIIKAGNHDATTSGTGMRIDGLVIRHYSWRNEDQYVRKIRNGQEAYARTNMPEDTGRHWRMWEGQPDEALVEHFFTWFHSDTPDYDDTLIYDPIVPVS